MRGTLKVVRTATNMVATITLTACASHELATGGVAKVDVLPGYTQTECHYTDPDGPPADSAGGAVRPGMVGAMFDKGGHQRTVECHHRDAIGPKEPTSGEPRAICSGPSGQLRICDVDWS
jgi:hypothetical protein